MKKKLTLLLIPITFSVFGIVYFQIDWLYKSYVEEFDTFNTIVNRSLSDALTKYKTEQKAADSIVLMLNLKKLVDTVKMKYSVNNDSLQIRLENRHMIALRGKYWASMTISTSSANIFVMSPSMLMNATKPRQNLDWNVYSKISNFVDSIFKVHDKSTDISALKADNEKIAHYFKENLSANGVTDTGKKNWKLISVKKQENSAKPGVSLIPYHQNVLHFYPGQNWVGIYFPGKQNWVFHKMLFKVCISAILILVLIFSFAALIRTILQQKQLADIKDDFIDNLTHEFKTPIATISAAIEGMQKFKALDDKEKTARYLEISKNELNRLNDMVTKLLNISVYEDNNLKLTLHEIDIESLVDDVVSMEQFRAVKPVKFIVDLDDNLKQIQADPVHFKNVLVNLIDNAVKYSKDSVKIKITSEKDKNTAVFKIRDNGIGISASELKRVFDKFYRVPTGDLHNVKGNGLGLSYVKSVIEAHSGTITVNSEINIKTEFIISLPLK